MADTIHYEEIEIPGDKNPRNYSYAERRAEIYHELKEAGHPSILNQSELAERYGVSQPTISKDMKKIREYRREHAGKQTISITEFVAEKAVRELINEGDYYNALKAQLDYNDWLFEAGINDRAPKRTEQQINADVTNTEPMGGVSLGADAGGDDGDDEAGSDGLTDKQCEHIEALTGGRRYQ